VANAIKSGNVNLPTGILYGTHQAFTLEARGQLNDAEAYRPLIVAYRNGSPVRLGELGKVIDSVENDKTASWYNNIRSIGLAIYKQPGTNTVRVVDSIRDLLPTLRAQMPGSVNLDIFYDRSISIRDSVNDVKFTLLLTMCLVVLVIFLFLRNLSATVIPSLALPMSVIGTFSVMYLLDYSLDNLSLMALTLSVGFVVEDAIVMLENIVRHMEMGEKPFEAALKGSREIGFTILSMTLSLVAVFIPVLFMGGIIGRLLNEFAVTIGVAILVSGFVSLSLTPMLCSRFLRPPGEKKQSYLYATSERFFRGMLKTYQWSLRLVLNHRLTISSSILILVITIFLFMTFSYGFLPSEDIGQLFGLTEAVQGISFESMKQHQIAVAEAIRQDSNVGSISSTAGAGGPQATGNVGRVMIALKPRSERKLNADEVIQGLRPKLANIPGIQTFLQNPPPINIGGMMTKAQYQFTLQSPEVRELYQYTPVLEAKLRELPELQDVTSDLQIKNPQVNIEIDRDKASALRVTANQIEESLQCLWNEAGLDDLYLYQSVPGHHRTGASIPDGSFCSLHALYPILYRAIDPSQCRSQFET
jgi:HAE1 family hydrophobic/amphiphilic exporter-1